jgi:hypothetical protein
MHTYRCMGRKIWNSTCVYMYVCLYVLSTCKQNYGQTDLVVLTKLWMDRLGSLDVRVLKQVVKTFVYIIHRQYMYSHEAACSRACNKYACKYWLHVCGRAFSVNLVVFRCVCWNRPSIYTYIHTYIYMDLYVHIHPHAPDTHNIRTSAYSFHHTSKKCAISYDSRLCMQDSRLL